MLRATLKVQRITTCDKLLAAAGHFNDRAALAQSARLDLDQLTGLVRQADLARVQGVGVVFGSMLADLGVGDVGALAQQEPNKLHERLRLLNESDGVARRSPTAAEVTDWIAQARRLPGLVTYASRGKEAAR